MSDIELADPSTPEELRPLRTFLEDAGFTEARLARRLDMEDIYDFVPISLGRPAGGPPKDVLDVLVRLFLDAEPVDPATLERWIPEEIRRLLEESGILGHTGEGRPYSRVILYPTQGLFIASDPPHDPSGEDTPPRPDAVYPAVTRAASHFVSSLPRSPCGTFLELCSGSGIGALVGARNAEEAWAVDITERSTRFARFNAALNGIENMTARRGDLWEPVRGLTFDRIVAHPPYMPSGQVSDIYRDGGADGEEVTRGILEGLDEHLAPGGRFFATCTLTEREGTTLEDRVREMVGPGGESMNLLLLTMGQTDPARSLTNELLRGRVTAEEAQSRWALFQELGVTSMVYLTFVLEKPAGGSTEDEAFTLRRPRGPESRGGEIEWLMDLVAGLGSADGESGLADARPAASPHVHLVSDSPLVQGEWEAREMRLQTRYPFPTTIRCAPWLPDFVAGCDGSATLREALADLRDRGALRAGVEDGAFLEMIRSLLVAGILLLPDHPLPTPRGTSGGEGV